MSPESDDTWDLRRPPVGARPGTLEMPPGATAPRLRLCSFEEEAFEETEVGLEEALEALERRRGLAPGAGPVLWLDVQGLGDETLVRALADALGMHALTLEDVVHTHQRPKLDVFDDHLLVFARAVCGRQPADTSQLALMLCPGALVTFQERHSDCFEPVRQRLQIGRGLLRRSGADVLAYALLDAVVDAYFPVIEAIGDRLEDLEEEALGEPTQDTVRRIHALRGELLQLRRVVRPLREVLTHLLREESELLGETVRTYLRDVLDHVVHMVELLEHQREAVSSLMNTYLSTVANRQNEVMKVLTLVTSIFIPLSFLVGLYGMNFQHMPELAWPWAYPALLVVMALLAGAMLASFWRRGWLPPLRRSAARDTKAGPSAEGGP